MMLLVLGVTVFLPAYVRTGGYVQYEKKIHCALEKYDCRYVRVRFRTLTEFWDFKKVHKTFGGLTSACITAYIY